MNTLQNLLIALFLAVAAGHSQMTDPQSIAPMTCRLGGEPQFGVETCEGPCDMRAIHGNYAIHNSPSNPARVYRRGETMTIKYMRNNHGPGGIIRLTLVRPGDMMDKRVHERNAFYYSCWGANSVKAAPGELGKQRYGYSMIGSDGEQHNLPPGYYTSKVTIPRVIPDGDYVLGWVWFGGTGGSDVDNKGPASRPPSPYGYFSDYWSCSFIRIRGGGPLQASYVPVFKNDMSKFSSEGCMSANDFPGVCSYEPCLVTGRYQKPRPFAGGRTPRALTPRDFGGDMPSGGTPPSSRPPTRAPTTAPPRRRTLSEAMLVRRRSCRCFERGIECWRNLASRTRNYCKMRTPSNSQPTICKEACCVFCKDRPLSKDCKGRRVRNLCML